MCTEKMGCKLTKVTIRAEKLISEALKSRLPRTLELRPETIHTVALTKRQLH